MTDKERKLVNEVADFENLLASLQAIRTRQDSERGKTLVALRRQLSAQVAEIASLTRPLLDQRGDEAAKNEFRRLHSALLSTLALHQANWPAVHVVKADDNHEYRQSAQAVDQAAAAMIRCIRDKLLVT